MPQKALQVFVIDTLNSPLIPRDINFVILVDSLDESLHIKNSKNTTAQLLADSVHLFPKHIRLLATSRIKHLAIKDYKEAEFARIVIDKIKETEERVIQDYTSAIRYHLEEISQSSEERRLDSIKMAELTQKILIKCDYKYQQTLIFSSSICGSQHLSNQSMKNISGILWM